MSFSGMTILFTGKLKNMKREDAEAKVVALGGKVASSVTKNLSVLVASTLGMVKPDWIPMAFEVDRRFYHAYQNKLLYGSITGSCRTLSGRSIL